MEDKMHRDRAGRSELHYAAGECDVDKVRQLLSLGFDPNLADDQGFTPLHFAAQEDCDACVVALLGAGASCTAKNIYGNSPLGTAVYNYSSSPETIEALLAAGADVDDANNSGVSPRRLAETIGDPELINLLK